MRNFHSGEKKWFKRSPAIIVYLIYLLLIERAKKANHALINLTCSQCELPFLSTRSNLGRSDIYCPFGCRQEHKKAKARERAKKYYQKPDKREQKKKINRARSEVNKIPEKKPPIIFHNIIFVMYLKIILSSILNLKIQPTEIIQLLKIVRSRGLSFYKNLIHYTDYG